MSDIKSNRGWWNPRASWVLTQLPLMKCLIPSWFLQHFSMIKGYLTSVTQKLTCSRLEQLIFFGFQNCVIFSLFEVLLYIWDLNNQKFELLLWDNPPIWYIWQCFHDRICTTLFSCYEQWTGQFSHNTHHLTSTFCLLDTGWIHVINFQNALKSLFVTYTVLEGMLLMQ